MGQTVRADGAPAVEIHASDVYEWVAGGFFVVHTAYRWIGDNRVSGIEMIGYDAQAKRFRTDFFDSQGNVSNQDLIFSDGTWTWSGPHARARGFSARTARPSPRSTSGRTMV